MDTGNGYRGRIPFAPLQLTFEEQEKCQESTLQLLDRMLRDYAERDAATNRSPRHHSKLGSSQWKRIKTQYNASLYCERGHTTHQDFRGNWQNPAALLAVGTIQGSLDDVMLGLTTQSFADLQLKAASVASQDLRGAMLAKLSGPTEEDPFKCLSVVWMVSEQKWPLNMIVCPRDFVNLSASGVVTRANGERIGYDLLQPAQLPQLPALLKPMVRGKMMYGALYREQNGSVDVYVKLCMETRGSVANTLLVNALSLVALGFGKAQRLSEEKKLEWCILSSMMNPRSIQNSNCSGRTVCSSCKTGFTRRRGSQNSRFGATDVCAVCTSVLCPRCRMKRSLKITTGRSRGATTRSMPVVVCQECLGLVYQQRAGEIAWQQYQHRLQYSVTDTCCSDRPVWGLVDETLMFAWSPDRHFSISDVFLNNSDGEGGCERSITCIPGSKCSLKQCTI